MRRLTASDRSALIKLASSLPSGSAERKAILAGLQGIGPEQIAKVRADLNEILREGNKDLSLSISSKKKFAPPSLKYVYDEMDAFYSRMHRESLDLLKKLIDELEDDLDPSEWRNP